MTLVLPVTDWSQVSMKPVLIGFLRRLDKMMAKIHKNQKIYNSIDWNSVANILQGKLKLVLIKLLKIYSSNVRITEQDSTKR